MPPAAKGMFELPSPPAAFSPLLVVVKDEALNADVFASGVLKMGGRLILLKELTMDTRVMMSAERREPMSRFNERQEADYLNERKSKLDISFQLNTSSGGFGHIYTYYFSKNRWQTKGKRR